MEYFRQHVNYLAGNVGIGTTNPTAKLEVQDGWIYESMDNNWASIQMNSYSSLAGHSGVFNSNRARGTKASPSYVLNGDILGLLTFRNHTNGYGSEVVSLATEDHSGSKAGSDLRIRTVPNGSNLSADRMIITNAGNVGVGTTNPTAANLLINA